MKKEVINSPKVGKGFSSTTCHATRAGGFVFVTGQVANKPDVGGDPFAVPELGGIEEQAVQVLENLKAILEEAGTSLENVVKRNVYLTHVSDFPKVYKIMERYFTSPMASTGILAGLVPPSARLEIDVIAAIPD